MPNVTKLRVLARARIEDPFSDEPVVSVRMMPHYPSQAAGIRRFHGLKHDPSLGPPVRDPKTDQPTGQNHGGFVLLKGDIQEVAPSTEYLRALRCGDLWAADEATAKYAGIPFDPTYGGEHPPSPAAPTAPPTAPPPAVTSTSAPSAVAPSK